MCNSSDLGMNLSQRDDNEFGNLPPRCDHKPFTVKVEDERPQIKDPVHLVVVRVICKTHFVHLSSFAFLMR